MQLATALTLALLVAPQAFAGPQPHNAKDIASYQKEITWLIDSYTLAYRKKLTTPQVQAMGRFICNLSFGSSLGEGTDIWNGVATGVCLDVEEQPRATVVVKVTVTNLNKPNLSNFSGKCSNNLRAALGLSLTLEGFCSNGWKEYTAKAEFTPLY